MDENQISVCKILAEAGNAILDVYDSNDFNARLKSDNTPVTTADKNSSKIINAGLKELFPGIPVLDEETAIPAYEVRKEWPRYFLVDPLDGTKEFINRNGEFCINLAVIENSAPVEGWIYQPLKKRGWHCKRGYGIEQFDAAGRYLKLEPPAINPGVIRITTSRSFFKPLEAEIIDEIKKSFDIEIIHRGSSLKQIDIITGNADMYLKAGPCSEWDTAPGQLFVEEFGGSVLKLNDFKTLSYNRRKLINPYFVMLNAGLNNPEFINFVKDIVKRIG